MARIVLITPSDPVIRSVRATLDTTGDELVVAGDASSAQKSLDAAPDLAIFDLLGEGPKLSTSELGLLMAHTSEKRMQKLALVDSDLARRLVEHHRLPNFLGARSAKEFDEQELAATILKLLSTEIFGLGHYFGKDARFLSMSLHHSREKDAALDAVSELAAELGCHRCITTGLLTVTDELVTNAFYDAPINTQGNARYAHLLRSEPVMLREGEEILFRVGWDDGRIAISAEDSFGALRPERILECLSHCFASDEQVGMDGQRGLGLYFVFNLMHHSVYNISPGAATEIIAIAKYKVPYRDYETRPRSLNVFVAEDHRGSGT